MKATREGTALTCVVFEMESRGVKGVFNAPRPQQQQPYQWMLQGLLQPACTDTAPAATF